MSCIIVKFECDHCGPDVASVNFAGKPTEEDRADLAKLIKYLHEKACSSAPTMDPPAEQDEQGTGQAEGDDADQDGHHHHG